jgi:hypothetical protein
MHYRLAPITTFLYFLSLRISALMITEIKSRLIDIWPPEEFWILRECCCLFILHTYSFVAAWVRCAQVQINSINTQKIQKTVYPTPLKGIVDASCGLFGSFLNSWYSIISPRPKIPISPMSHAGPKSIWVCTLALFTFFVFPHHALSYSLLPRDNRDWCTAYWLKLKEICVMDVVVAEATWTAVNYEYLLSFLP